MLFRSSSALWSSGRGAAEPRGQGQAGPWGEEEEGAPLAPGQDAPREGLGPAAEGLLQEEDEAGLRPKAELFQKPPQGPAAHRQGSLEEGRRPEGGDEEAGVGEEPGLGLEGKGGKPCPPLSSSAP